MRIIVTGSTGFVGSYFVKNALLANHELFLIGRINGNSKFGNKIFGINENTLLDSIEKFMPEVVLDLATYYNLFPSFDKIEKFIDGTLTFHMKISKITKNFAVPLIYTGSFWQRLTEYSGSSVSEYHFFKQVTENYLKNFSRKDVFSVDLFDTYSENDPRDKIVAKLLNLNPNDVPLKLSRGDQLINLLHVDDVIGGLLTLCRLSVEKSTVGNHFTLFNDDFYSLREVASIIQSKSNFKLPLIWGEIPYRPGEIFEIPTISNKLPEWKPQINFIDWLETLKR